MAVNTLPPKPASGKTAAASAAKVSRDVVGVDAASVHFISIGLNGTLLLTKKLEGQLQVLHVT